MPEQTTQMPPAMPFTGMMQNEPNQLLSQITRPAQTPEEVIERKGLWQTLVEKINTDPNLQNAMLMMGTNLMQPVGAGQTPAGHVGQALGAGFGVYKAGEYSQYQQQAQAAEAGREERKTEAGVGKAKAETAAVTQATDLARQLEQSQVERGRLEVSALQQRIASAKTKAEVEAVEAEMIKRKAEIERSIPDPALRAARLAELQKPEADLNEARKRAANYEAAAGHYRARTASEQQQVDALEGLPKEEQRAFFSKTGKYSATAVSSVVQQGEFWGRIYDALPAEDTEKKGKTREQYMSHKLKQATQKSQIETLTKALQNVSDPDLQQQLEEMIKLEVEKMRSGRGAAPGGESGTAGKIKWTVLPNGWRRGVKPDGTIILERPKSPGPGAVSPGGPQP